jgi:hypothetical protein
LAGFLEQRRPLTFAFQIQQRIPVLEHNFGPGTHKKWNDPKGTTCVKMNEGAFWKMASASRVFSTDF